MRSILASLFVVTIGILAALPFRRTPVDEPSPPPLDQSQVASLESPLEELDSSGGQLPSLPTNESFRQSVDGFGAIDPLLENHTSLPTLPTSRRPFREALVQPQAQLPDAAEVTAQELVQASPVWIAGGPLRYQSNRQEPSIDAIADTAPDTSIREPTEIQPPHQMMMQQAATRGQAESKTQAADPKQMMESPRQEPRRQNRQRHFIYEPVN